MPGEYDFDAATYAGTNDPLLGLGLPNVPHCNQTPFVGVAYVYELTYPAYSEVSPIDRFFMTFDGRCGDVALVGCVSFGNR